jgi:serine phosphatase RsbU (regulator of sigma subunit)
MAGYADEMRERFADLPMSLRSAQTDAARTGRPVIIRSLGEYERQYPALHASAVAVHAASWLAWPLRAGGAPVGAIGLMWRTPQQFEPGQLAFVAAVADLIAQALVRARVYADEHAIAVLLQRAVMPTMAAAIRGLDVGVRYRQAGATRQVGGDWYDVLALPAGRAYLAVGDVVGHGLTAAEDMTQLRNAGRALAIAGHQPASMLCELARVTDWATSGKYATMAAAIIEPDVSRLSYATAGHRPILIRRARTGTVEIPPPAAGPPLCVVKDDAYPHYTQGHAGFDVSDIVLMYTDGLIEHRGEDLAEGIGRLVGQLAAWQPGPPLGDLCDELISSLAADPQLDDICVLAVSRQCPSLCPTHQADPCPLLSATSSRSLSQAVGLMRTATQLCAVLRSRRHEHGGRPCGQGLFAAAEGGDETAHAGHVQGADNGAVSGDDQPQPAAFGDRAPVRPDQHAESHEPAHPGTGHVHHDHGVPVGCRAQENLPQLSRGGDVHRRGRCHHGRPADNLHAITGIGHRRPPPAQGRSVREPGRSAGSRGEAGRPGLRTGWLVNRDVMVPLPNGSSPALVSDRRLPPGPFLS